MFSEFELRRGKIAAAYAAATESVQLAAETGQAALSSFSLVILGRAEAILGHDEDCRAHVAAGLDFSRRIGLVVIEIYAAAVLGLLELSRGHADRAAIHLDECARLEKQYSTGILLPTITQWAADLVEAHIRSGAITDAERSLAMLGDVARRTGLRDGRRGAGYLDAGAPLACGNQARFDGVRPLVTGNSRICPDSAAARLRCGENGVDMSCRAGPAGQAA